MTEININRSKSKMNSEFGIMQPVHNPEIERIVVASVINSYNLLVDTLDILTSECFSDAKYREMYDSAIELYNRGETPDMSLVAILLRQKGSEIKMTDVINVCTRTNEVIDAVPHAKILRDLALRRRMWHIGYSMMTRSTDETVDVVEIHSQAKDNIDSLFESGHSEVQTLSDSFDELKHRLVSNQQLEDGETFGTPTGFEALDRNGGLCGSDLIVIGAESSKGKTSFATSLVMSAIERGDGVGFYSMEMMPVQLTARIAAMKTGINASRILYQKLSIGEIARIDAAMNSLNKSSLYFDDRSTQSLDSILMSIRSLKFKYGIKGAVVDYLQLINHRENGLNIEQCRAECARRLKNLAKELDIWIIAISQLNRNDYGAVPSMARLRDSGQIAEAADNVLLLHRTDKSYPEPFNGIPTKETSMVIVGKGRNIGTGEFICGFKPGNTLFYPLAEWEVLRMKQNDATVSDSIYDEPF